MDLELIHVLWIPVVAGAIDAALKTNKDKWWAKLLSALALNIGRAANDPERNQ